ncbi:MAG: cation diffusion facilitator family transporter [Planctomycetia bacterium]|nr:cation diffusion facilitator family transporter [Planctomycetia bacterium]
MESEGPQKSWIDRIPRVESRAAGISLVVSVGLLVVKFVAFFLTGSAAIFSDAVESIANVMGASVALFALGVAHSPADEEHPYGHGKVEFLSAMFEGNLVLLAAVFILFRTVDVMLGGELVREGQLELGLWLTGLALAINGGVGFYLIRTGRKQGSMTLEADGKHLMSDALTSIAVLVGLALVKLTGWSYFDPITAILIGLFIGGMAINLLRGSAAKLMDTQDPEDMQTLTKILDGHVGPEATEPRICAYHKLRHRHSGRFHWVDFHLMVPADWTIQRAHAAAGAIEGEIERTLEHGDATAHIEPCAREDCPRCRGR